MDTPVLTQMTKLEKHLISTVDNTYANYYNGKMSYSLHGEEWAAYVAQTFTDLANRQTSENIFKDVIDLYVSSIMPTPPELSGFRDSLVPLLCYGQAPVIVLNSGEVIWPEQFEILSDGQFTIAAIFTRNLAMMKDCITFVSAESDEPGQAVARLFTKDIPEDFSVATTEGFQFSEETHGHTLYRFALDDKGMGGSLSALQDRANHSIIDQTVIAEMYARPFWYLLNVEIAPHNPYLPASSQSQSEELREHATKGSGGRIFTTSSEGPFGQLTPPTIKDMIDYHDSIIAKVSQSTGIPEFYFKPGTSNVPSGTALKVLSRRFNTKVSRIRDSISATLLRLSEHLGIQPEPGDDEVVLWGTADDLLQEALDAHGEALFRMGYPLDYIAEVVTPGVDLDEYLDDGFKEEQANNLDTLF